MTTRNMKFGSSICVWGPPDLVGGVRADCYVGRPKPSDRPHLGLHGLPFQQGRAEDGVLDFHRFVLLFTHSFSPRIRFVGELELEHAFVEGLEESGRARAGTGLPGFPAHAGVQHPRGHAAGAGRHHQRAPRAAGLSRRRAAVRRHGHHPDDVVRRRRRRSRRGRPRLAIPRVRRWRRSTRWSSRADEGIREGRQKGSEANVRNVACTGRARIRRHSAGSTLGASFWTRRVGLRSRRGSTPGARRRSRRPLPARHASSCAASSRRSSSTTPAQLNDAMRPADRRVAQHRARMRGFYGEARYRIWQPRRRATSSASCATRTSTRSSACRRAFCR